MLDPESAHIVFESVEKPMVVVPWETCIDGDMNLDFVSIFIQYHFRRVIEQIKRFHSLEMAHGSFGSS